MFPRVTLRKNKTDAVRRFHPWIFSGALHPVDESLRDGDVVEVVTERGEVLATGHYSPGSIAVRVVAFGPVGDLRELWRDRLRSAFRVREVLGLVDNTETSAYRLVHAEGDGLPGLVIDWYNGTAVLQAHSAGMYAARGEIADVLRELCGPRLKAVYDKSTAVLHGRAGSAGDGYLFGSRGDGIVTEYGHRFRVDWEEGQKTGFFLDQRENRRLLGSLCLGRDVLNAYAYTGGFSVYAAAGGARSVRSVDSSEKALALAGENIRLNHPDASHELLAGDVFDHLGKCADGAYDVIVLDPPAFAKGLSAKHSAVQAYRRLNRTAMQKIRKGGLLFTFSCSQAVGRDLFLGAVTAAAIDAGRQTRILHHLTQPADHPVSVFHPEGMYLKGFVLEVE